MPFRRRKFRRFRKRNFKRGNTRIATKSYVKKQIAKEAETKYFDTTFAAGVSDTGTVACTTLVPQGTTDLSRIGDKLSMKAYRFRYTWQVGDSFNSVRLILFQWYINSSFATPQVNQILSSPGVGVAITSPYVNDYANQFNILYDKVLSLYTDKPLINIQGSPRTKYMKKIINFTGATTEGSNHIWMIVISDSGAVTHPNLVFHSRLWFEDS